MSYSVPFYGNGSVKSMILEWIYNGFYNIVDIIMILTHTSVVWTGESIIRQNISDNHFI